MVAPHAEDRFIGPDWYFGKQGTDVTRECHTNIPTHSYHPQFKNAPTPYHVIPYHDMSDKFRNRILRDRVRERRAPIPENSYFGRTVTEITSPIRFRPDEKEMALFPWPETSNHIGDMSFNRHEYLHPLGRTRPSPMDDYVPVLRDRKTGKPITPIPTGVPTQKESRRRLLGLPPDGCHSPSSPCRSRSPAREGREGDDPDDDLGHSHNYLRLKRLEQERMMKGLEDALTAGEGTPSPPAAQPEVENLQDDYSETDHQPSPAPVQEPEPSKPRRRASRLASTYGSLSGNVQPVGGRAQHMYEEELESKRYCNNPQESSMKSDEIMALNRYSLGGSGRRAQPVGGRASIVNLLDLEQARNSIAPGNEHSTPGKTRAYPPQHHSFSYEAPARAKNDEAIPRNNHYGADSIPSRSHRKHSSPPPKYDPNLPPEKERGRSHRYTASLNSNAENSPLAIYSSG